MPTEIYKLFAQGTSGTTQDSAAALDIRTNGAIMGFILEIWGEGMDALDDTAQLEVSFLATNTFTVSDTRGSIGMVDVSANLTTSGAAKTVNVVAIGGLNIPVAQGERIYLHTKGDAGVTPFATVYLYVDQRGVGRTATRRT